MQRVTVQEKNETLCNLTAIELRYALGGRTRGLCDVKAVG